MNAIVDEVELFTDLERNGKHIIHGMMVSFIELESEPIAWELKMSNNFLARVAYKPKEISINSTLGTVEIKIIHKLILINSRTSLIPIHPLGMQDPPHVNEIPVIDPSLIIMIVIHIRHVMNDIHVVRRSDVTVHHVMGEVDWGETIREEEELVVDLLVWGVGLLLGKGLVH